MKQLDSKTTSRGLRMPTRLWLDLDELAKADKRKTSQFLTITLQDYVDKLKKLKK